MTACEVLCWIGYGRAIAKEVYFRPIFEAPDMPFTDIAPLLHQSVPGPKPPECPMDSAERELMAALRSGKIQARCERNGALEIVPSEIYDYAVAVNARGSIETDQGAAGRDIAQADRYLRGQTTKIKDVFFRTSEVRECLKAWSNKLPALMGTEATPASTAMTLPWPAKKTGPKSGLTERTAQMLVNHIQERKVTLVELHGWDQESLKTYCGVGSRSTAKKALEIAFQIVTNSNSDK